MDRKHTRPAYQESRKQKLIRYLRPLAISVTVTLLAFFMLQGIPLAGSLDRRTDLVSVDVIQNGTAVQLTDPEQIVRAAEVAGMLSRRFSAQLEAAPDTLHIYHFQDGSQLEIGVFEDKIWYDGKWYNGATQTPKLFRDLTTVRFFQGAKAAPTEG